MFILADGSPLRRKLQSVGLCSRREMVLNTEANCRNIKKDKRDTESKCCASERAAPRRVLRESHHHQHIEAQWSQLYAHMLAVHLIVMVAHVLLYSLS